jgi:hypothetical protein
MTADLWPALMTADLQPANQNNANQRNHRYQTPQHPHGPA